MTPSLGMPLRKVLAIFSWPRLSRLRLCEWRLASFLAIFRINSCTL